VGGEGTRRRVTPRSEVDQRSERLVDQAVVNRLGAGECWRMAFKELASDRAFHTLQYGAVANGPPEIWMTKIVVATCQFPVSANIDSNLQFILSHMRSASSQ